MMQFFHLLSRPAAAADNGKEMLAKRSLFLFSIRDFDALFRTGITQFPCDEVLFTQQLPGNSVCSERKKEGNDGLRTYSETLNKWALKIVGDLNGHYFYQPCLIKYVTNWNLTVYALNVDLRF